MPVNEQDIEMLEAYLDDALGEAQIEQVRQRLELDGQWVAALEDLRSQRAVRRALYASIEPDDAAVDQFVLRVQGAVVHQRRFALVTRSFRYVAAAAACIVIGFVGRGMFNSRTVESAKSGHATVEAVTAYQVTLRDENGKVVAVQRFDSLEKAQEFAGDLSRWQNRTEQLAGGKFVVTADRF